MTTSSPSYPTPRGRYTPGRGLGAPRLLVIHATAGSHPGDLRWLRQGGAPGREVSCHYYIDKGGEIAQLLGEDDTAWHCGPSSWVIDGERRGGSHAGVATLNHLSIGIELSNRNDGRDPYPAAQVDACIGLAAHIIARHQIPLPQVVRHLDISPGRKTDPAGFPWDAFLAALGPAPLAYTADSAILGRSPMPPDRLALALARRCPQVLYHAADLARLYHEAGLASGVNALLAVAQMCHETGNLTSFWSQPPQRNLAGIGVTGAHRPTRPLDTTGWAYNPQRGRWEAGLSFPTLEAGVAAHVGRLLAYATPPSARWGPQVDLADAALRWRPLALKCQGSATTLRALGREHNATPGCGWAWPGDDYGAAIAATANALLRLAVA